jgi:hypothetical protein
LADGLTAKQAAFVREYLVDRNATQAAIRAGYSPKTAEQQGYQLLQNTSVSEALQSAEKRLSIKAEITEAEVIQGLREIAQTGTNESARVTAWTNLGKHIGMFKDRQPGDGADNPLFTKPIAEVPAKETESYAWQNDSAGSA